VRVNLLVLALLLQLRAWPQCLSLVSITVTPANQTIAKGTTQQFVATGTYTNGQVTVTADISAIVSWSSSNSLVVSINSSGLATGLAPGGVTVQASSSGVSGSAGLTVTAVIFPGITYDMWIDFEHNPLGSAVTASALANSTHGTAGSWDVSQSRSLLTVVGAGEDPSHAVTGDTGTRGLAVNLVPGGQEYIQWNLPADKHALSFGLWYRTYQSSPWDEGPHVITLYNNAYGPLFRFSDERSGVNNARQFRISPSNSAIVGISDTTWYWLTMKWVQGGSGIASVYDSNLNLVGTVTFSDTVNVPTQAILLGNSASEQARAGQSVYIDDVIIDYTNTVFPLLPAKIQ